MITKADAIAELSQPTDDPALAEAREGLIANLQLGYVEVQPERGKDGGLLFRITEAGKKHVEGMGR